MKHSKHLLTCFQFAAFLILVLLIADQSFAQKAKDTDPEVKQALELITVGQHLKALPLLEKIAVRYPNDGEMQAHFGIAILANAVTIKDEEQRKKDFARGSEILKKAKKLGTTNVTALHYLDKIEAGSIIDGGFSTSNKQVEDAIREGEGFFGRGEYEKAFAAYKRAYDLDPENYEAALFAGDCYYSLKKYKESESWFAKAVSINKYGEAAYRFWGDALLYQKKIPQAIEKFSDAIIAESDSRISWDRFFEVLKDNSPRTSSPYIFTPGTEDSDSMAIVVDPKLLKAEDGTLNWSLFTEIRDRQKKAFEKVANGRKFEPTVSEDVEALKVVSAAVKIRLGQKKITKLDPGLENLLKINELGLLDAYVILFLHGGNACPEFEEYREKNWGKLQQLLVEHIAGIKPVNNAVARL